MEYFHKKMSLLFLIMFLLSYGNRLLSYTYYITNLTGKEVKVQLYHAFGPLNDKPEPIESSDTHRFSWGFPSLKIGYCIHRILVSIKEAGKWRPLLSAPIRFVSGDQFKGITESGGFIEKIFTKGLSLWDATLCGNRDFILVIDPDFSLVTDPDFSKVVALTFVG